MAVGPSRGGEGEHPQVRDGGGWWDLWAPFWKGQGRGCLGGNENLQRLPAEHESLVGLRGSGQSSLGQGRREQSSVSAFCFMVFPSAISSILTLTKSGGEP